MKQYKIKIDGKAFDIAIDGIDENGVASVTVNGQVRRVELDPSCIAHRGTTAVSPIKTPRTVSTAPSEERSAAVSTESGTAVASPLPGVILSIKVNVGDKVSAGDCVAVLEAMKMENDIQAEIGGTVRAIHVQKGDSVLEGAKIVTIG